MQCGDDRRALKLPTRRISPDRSLASVGPKLVLAVVSSVTAMMSSPSSFAAEFPGNQGVPHPPDPPPVSADSPPAVVPFRPFRFKLNFGAGGYDAADVKRYLSSKGEVASSASVLCSFDVSAAYFPVRFFGMRPGLAYFFATNPVWVDWLETRRYWLNALAPGLAVDLVVDGGNLARFFASPGLSYQWAWFEGYGAHGLGLELAIGAELSFGQARAQGLSLALVVRKATLDVSGRPASPPPEAPRIDTLDLTSVMLRLGFQAARRFSAAD
jgi:hypothetical protein